MEHSKLPWNISEWSPRFIRGDGGKKLLIEADSSFIRNESKIENKPLDEANAAFIVTACNYHQDLMDLCRNLLTDNVDVNSAWNLLDEIKRSVLK